MKVAKSILTKGTDYAKNETERLHRMLEKVPESESTLSFK